MKMYLEIQEKLIGDEVFDRLPEIIRVEVESEEDAVVTARELESLMKCEKTILFHQHFHSKNPDENQPCSVKEIFFTQESLEKLP